MNKPLLMAKLGLTEYPKILKVGQELVDLGAPGNGGNLEVCRELHEKFDVRSMVQFSVTVNKDENRLFPMLDNQRNATHALNDFLRAVVGMVHNKHLYTIGKPDRDGWWPCAYQYDWDRFGMCEVRERKDV
jgi:hypothetical protein